MHTANKSRSTRSLWCSKQKNNEPKDFTKSEWDAAQLLFGRVSLDMLVLPHQILIKVVRAATYTFYQLPISAEGVARPRHAPHPTPFITISNLPAVVLNTLRVLLNRRSNQPHLGNTRKQAS